MFFDVKNPMEVTPALSRGTEEASTPDRLRSTRFGAARRLRETSEGIPSEPVVTPKGDRFAASPRPGLEESAPGGAELHSSTPSPEVRIVENQPRRSQPTR
jgi:hypothetical protein